MKIKTIAKAAMGLNNVFSSEKSIFGIVSEKECFLHLIEVKMPDYLNLKPDSTFRNDKVKTLLNHPHRGYALPLPSRERY